LIAVGQVTIEIVPHAEVGFLEPDIRPTVGRNDATELVSRIGAVEDQQVERINNVLIMLKPITVTDEANRVILPDPHTAEHNVIAGSRIDYIIQGEQGFLLSRPHIKEYKTAIFMHRVGRLPDVHFFAKSRALAWHIETFSIWREFPTVVTATKTILLDATIFK
jgi:hypothetical protein